MRAAMSAVPRDAQLDRATRKSLWQYGSRDGNIVEAENLAAVFATKMRVAIVRGRIRRSEAEAEYALHVGHAMREAALDHPVEHAIKRHAVKAVGMQGKLDIVVRKRALGGFKQAYHRYARGRGARAKGTDALSRFEGLGCCSSHDIDWNTTGLLLQPCCV
jgi:hypothetical protein